ncbi:hypothetical protein TRFO_30820 [Tritrichomonas foetus]|uniref:Protein NO VEIN C-terminal domain-containing protein n=1 Tax=Tritrichomonas foetus TaxID=1144522 RepID=A0A1J4JTW9_9EUKA|nr:hypothetical protein TRFO_30820 [Tritrichomonas foetus]|eukprot:OHT02194.1 hypothetical protein TRFO_30820 [Tritrichomonas foetus]
MLKSLGAEAADDFLKESYVQATSNRLRVLQSPSEPDKKRWIWELIQNAKDTRANDPFQRKVDVRVIIKNNYVKFKHNGAPFHNNHLLGLILKLSSGKRDQVESTGRFGTGFLTTHTLSKIVEVKAPFTDGHQNKAISFTLYRNSTTDEELKQNIDQTFASKKEIPDRQWTSYKYILRANENKDIRDLGIRSLELSIWQTLIFCPLLGKIEVKKETFLERYQVKSITKLNNEIKQFVIVHTNGLFSHERRFMVTSINQHSPMLSEKFGRTRSLNIDIAIEVNPLNNSIISCKDQTCLYCTFPLIGSENHQFPFYFNSPDFEPDTERQNIPINGPDRDSEGRPTISAINKMIIQSSIPMFSKLLEFFITKHFTGYWFLSNGITTLGRIENFNYLWYTAEFTQVIRGILEKSSIVKNTNNINIKLRDAWFPIYKNIQNKKMFHELFKDCINNTAEYNESIEWNDKLWDKISKYTLNDLLSLISKGNFDNKFLNRVIQFVNSQNPNLLNRYPLIPNMKGNLCLLSNLRGSEEINNDMIQILEAIGSDWTKTHINSSITVIPLRSIDRINDAINQIHNITRNFSKSNILVTFIPRQNHKRLLFYEFAQTFLGNIAPKKEISDLDERIWDNCDNYIIEQVINRIQTKNNILYVQNNIQNIAKFVSFLSQNQRAMLNQFAITPNQKFNLCLLYDLKNKSDDIPDEISNMLSQYFGISLDDDTINQSVKNVKCDQTIKMEDYINTINSQYPTNRDKADIVTKIIISYLPTSKDTSVYTTQKKFLYLYLKFINSNIVPKSINIRDEKFWSKTNDYIKTKICECMVQSSSLQQLRMRLGMNENDVISILNTCTQVLDNGGYIPNRNGVLQPANTLISGENIPDEIIEFLYVMNPSNDLRNLIADSRIISSYVSRNDFSNILRQASLEWESALANPTKRNDPKIMKAMKNYTFYGNGILSSLIMKPSPEEKCRRNLLNKLYVSNVINRLNELTNPKPHEIKRWPWELIQNAKDSIVASKTQKSIFIKIIADDDYVDFIHNGAPFTSESLLGLLYKYSEGKSGNNESTGKFGTGFLTTHILSRIVDISGNVISDDGSKYGFEVTLNRNGNSECELLKGVDSMEESKKYYTDKTSEFTKFHYPISSGKSKECMEVGIDYLMKNIGQTLLFCPSIEYIEIQYKGRKTLFRQAKTELSQNIRIIEKLINGQIAENKKFLFYSFTEHSKELTDYYKTNRNLTINGAIEFTDNNELVSHADQVSLYCTFPLIGSETNLLPILLNSPDFEPSTERNSIILHGRDYDDHGVITNTAINKLILTKSCIIYNNILNNVITNNFSNYGILTDGLVKKEHFINEWYERNFITNMRAIIENAYIITSNKGTKLLLNVANIPLYDNKFANIELKKLYHHLITVTYSNVACLEDSLLWNDRIWESLHFISVNDFVHKMEAEMNLNTSFDFINKLLSFIWNYDKNLLYNHLIIPDMNRHFTKLTNNFKESKSVSLELVSIMEKLNINWKSTHLHNDITTISIPEDSNENAIAVINVAIEHKNDLALVLLHYVIENDEHREKMFDFGRIFLNLHDSPIITSNLPTEIWEKADKICLEIFMEKISLFTEIEIITKINIIDDFLSFIRTILSDDKSVNKYKIVPNQKYELKTLCSLKNQGDINDAFNDMMISFLGFDCHAQEINSNISSVKCSSTLIMEDFIYDINHKFEDLDRENKILLSQDIIKFLPPQSNQVFYEYQNDLFTLFQSIIDPESESIVINITNELFWSQANKIVIQVIGEKIGHFDSLKDFRQEFEWEENEAINILNRCYKFIDNLKIFPNMYGEMHYINDLSLIQESKPELFDFLYEISNGYDIRELLAHEKIICPKMKIMSLVSFTEKLIKDFTSFLGDKEKQANSNFMEMLKKMNISDNNFVSSSFFMKDYEENTSLLLVHKLYIANIQNRLRKLSNPSDHDLMRWPWELIQNARDSIADIKEQKSVHMSFEFSEKSISFTHNGAPFTATSLYALLYEFSEGKEFSENCIGRFGTGFLSTHILSKIVNVTGDVKINANKNHGFEVVLNRIGDNSPELTKSLEAMEQSKKEFEQAFGYTKFEYVNTGKNQYYHDAYHKGLQSLESNIPAVLLFCPTIEYIEIKSPNQHITYSKTHEDGRYCYIKEERNNSTRIHKFLYGTQEIYEIPALSFVRRTNSLNIIGAFEVDASTNKLERPTKRESLFCSFPLIGSNIQSPMMINSNHFETSTEREAIFTSKSLSIEDKTSFDNKVKLNQTGFNNIILKESVNIFAKLIRFMIEDDVGSLYNLAYYIGEYLFKEEWYFNEFISPMRNTLLKCPIFKNEKNVNCTIHDICIPLKIMQPNEINRMVYDIIIRYKKKNYVSYDDSLQWNSLCPNDHWPNFPFYSLQQLVFDIQLFPNINDLPLDEAEKWEFLNDLFKIIMIVDQKLFEFRCVPDMNGSFHSLLPKFFRSETIPDHIIQLLNKMGNNWKTNHIHQNITCLDHIYKNHLIDALKFIMKKTESDTNSALQLMNYMKPGDSIQRKMYQFSLDLFPGQIERNIIYLEINDLNMINIWHNANNHLLSVMVNKIVGCGSLTQLHFDGVWLNKFLTFVNQQQQQLLSSVQIYPNQYGIFCRLEDLAKDLIIDDDLKDKLKTICNIDIYDKLLSKDITIVKCTNYFHLNDLSKDFCKWWDGKLKQQDNSEMIQTSSSSNKYENHKQNDPNSIINRILNSGNYQKNKKNFTFDEDMSIISHYFIQYLPDIKEVAEIKIGNKENEETKVNIFQKQAKLLELFNSFYGTGIKEKIYTGNAIELIYSRINLHIIREITEIIQNHAHIQSLQREINISSEEKMFKLLHNFYSFTHYGRIFPNMLGYFYELKYLFNGTIKQEGYITLQIDFIPEELIQIFDLLFFENNTSIKNSILHKCIKIYTNGMINIQIDQISHMIDNKIEESDKNEEKIMKVINMVLEYANKYKTLHHFPSLANSTQSSSPKIVDLFSKLDSKYKNYITNFVDDFNDDIIKYKGEAIVFERIKMNPKYSKIEWYSLSDTPTNLKIILGTNEYYIDKTQNHKYCINAISHDGKEDHFKVKSTRQRKGILVVPSNKYTIAHVLCVDSDNPTIRIIREEETL